MSDSGKRNYAIVTLAGLILFAIVFALNSAVHSYLILAHPLSRSWRNLLISRQATN